MTNGASVTYTFNDCTGPRGIRHLTGTQLRRHLDDDVPHLERLGGGTITHTYATGVTLTITYDGTAVAHWASTDGKGGTIHLLCTP